MVENIFVVCVTTEHHCDRHFSFEIRFGVQKILHYHSKHCTSA